MIRLSPSPTDIRSFPFRRYVIYYRGRSDRVEAIRVLSAYRDLGGLL